MRYLETVRSERRSVPFRDALSCGNDRTTDIRASARGIRVKCDLLLNAAAQGVWRGPVPPRRRRIPRPAATPFPYVPVMCVTSILTGSTRSLVRFAYSAAMADDSWKDARVRQAEEALANAVRTADEIIAEAQ